MMRYRDHNFFSAAEDIGDQLIHVSTRILKKALILVQSSAVAYAPYRTGILKGSITTELFSNYGIVGTNIEYAPHQEYGTRYMAARPFMRPALDNNINNIMKIARDEMRGIK